MASPYTSVSIADYNANPPSDDGAGTPANELNWSKHKEKLGDPIKTLSEAINTNLVAAFGDRLLNAEAQKTGIYTVLATDRGSLINCTANTFTVTLLAAATAGDGFEVIIYNSGSGVITVDGNASETVNGAATQTLATGGWLMLRCDGSNWAGVGGNENLTNVTSSADDLNVMAGTDAAGVTPTEVGYLNGVTSALQTQIDTKTSTSHDHDGGDGAAIPVGGLAADCIVASKIDFTFDSGGSQVISSGGTWTPAEGLYMWTNITGNGVHAYDVNQGAAWRTGAAGVGGGMFFTDGTNFRLNDVTAGGANTIYYLKLA